MRERERDLVYPRMLDRNINRGWKEWKTPILFITEHSIFEYVVFLISASSVERNNRFESNFRFFFIIIVKRDFNDLSNIDVS